MSPDFIESLSERVRRIRHQLAALSAPTTVSTSDFLDLVDYANHLESRIQMLERHVQEYNAMKRKAAP